MTNPKSTLSSGTSNSRLWLIIFLISIAAFMGALDGTIVNISLPTLSEYFKADLATVSWVAMAYLLVLSPADTGAGDVAGRDCGRLPV